MTTNPGGHILRIDSDIPFTDAVYGWMAAHRHELDTLASPSRRFENNYLAWETVRRRTNPFFENGTGFEGYFVGQCTVPEEALDHILTMSQSILDNLARMYHNNFPFQSRLMQTLAEEHPDPKAMYIWSAELGAALGRLRVNVSRNAEATAFNANTYRLVQMLPPIHYQEAGQSIRQAYAVTGSADNQRRALVTLSDLPPTRQHAWMVAQFIGKFGHPIVREFLRNNPARG